MSFQTVWLDIPCINVDRAMDFYTHVFDLRAQWQPKAEGRTALLFDHSQNEGKPIASLIYHPGVKPSQHGILLSIAVASIDETIRKVLKHQGNISMKAHSLGPYGTRAVIIDSEGNRLAVLEQKY